VIAVPLQSGRLPDGALQGFYINDSGSGRTGQFVSAHLMTTAFEHTGGFCVATDAAHLVARSQPLSPA
jgi:hypothetical protein